MLTHVRTRIRARTWTDMCRNQMTQWWAGPDVADRVFARLRPHLPMIVHGYRLCGVNLRFRAYKYAPYRNEANDAASEIAEEFLPHFDEPVHLSHFLRERSPPKPMSPVAP